MPPSLIAAHIDAIDRLILEFSRPIVAEDIQAQSILLREEDTGDVISAVAILPGVDQVLLPTELALISAKPLAAGYRFYRVEAFGRSVLAVPRGLLDDPTCLFDLDAHLGALYAQDGTEFRVFAPHDRFRDALIGWVEGSAITATLIQTPSIKWIGVGVIRKLFLRGLRYRKL